MVFWNLSKSNLKTMLNRLSMLKERYVNIKAKQKTRILGRQKKENITSIGAIVCCTTLFLPTSFSINIVPISASVVKHHFHSS